MNYVHLPSILALLVVFLHSFYSWDKAKTGDNLIASFEQFIHSSHSSVIVSAVEKAVQSYGDNVDSLCEEVIQIFLNNPMVNSYLAFQLHIDPA